MTDDAPESAPASRPPRAGLAGNGLASPALGASLTLLALIGLAYAIPGFDRFRLFTPLPEGAALVIAKPVVAGAAPVASVGEAALGGETLDDTPKGDDVEIPRAALEGIEGGREDKKPPRSIEDPSGHALDPFFDALLAAEQKKGLARITYFGDSIVASDFVTSTLRRRLQKRFGDAGHGFMLMANAWPGYSHHDVVRFAARGWQVSRVVGPFAKDGFYGLGGVSFRSEGPGVFSRFATTKTGTFGRAVSRFVVDYLEQPKGGVIAVKIDGEPRDTIDTSGPASKSAIRSYAVPDGEHQLEVRAMSANARTFGVWMERDEPGVVVDAIGIQGCRIRFLDQNDDAHFAEQLKLRDPALTVFQYGMNESQDGELFPLDQYESTMKAVLVQVKAALPRSSCLLVGPLDRVDKHGDAFTSRHVVPKLAAIQRKVAGEVGCAYWDTFNAMGGLGSMGTWFQRGLGSADYAHPSSAGAEVLGNWIYLALMEAYEAHHAQPTKR